MRMFMTTAAMMAALTVSAFAEGDLLGTEAQGEADGSFKASLQQPIGSSPGQFAMAQGNLPGEKIKSTKTAKAPTASKSKNLKRVSAKSGASSHASAIKTNAKQTSDEPYNDTGYSPESLRSPTGMDGGNRK
jgi:hypothetical protein